MSRSIHIVINPASGRPKPILHVLNRVFKEAGIDWDISLTKASGDAQRQARQAVEQGVDIVAAYGGDGTVMEVAEGLLGSKVPLAILPGGSANLMAVELGIPKELEQAAGIAANPDNPTRPVEVGKVGSKTFLLRIGIGFDARKVAYADRNLKNRIGMLAYSVAGLKAIKDSKQARYHLTIDGHQVESAAVTCLIDNAGNMGIQGVEPVKNIRIDDGYLDVLLLGTPGMFNTVSSGAAFLETGISDLLVEHWQAKQIIVEVDPAQPVQVDGEIVHDTPITAEIMPGALNVIIPKPK